jgi:hypothetical protein
MVGFRILIACALVAAAPACLRAGGVRPTSIPARVFSPYNDRVYIEEIGYLDPEGFRPDVAITPFFRTLNPAFVANGSPEEIAAAAGKILVPQAVWAACHPDRGEKGESGPSRPRVAADIYTIAGVNYVCVQ